jgi:ribose transport system substrate-binding protein
MKRLSITISALTLALAVGVPGFAQSEKNLKIAMIGKSMANPVFVAAHRGAQDTARTLGTRYGVQIDVSILTPDREDTGLQLERIRAAVADGADAILIAPTDASRATPAIDEAVAAGVAVMTFDNDAPRSRRFSHFGPDDVAVGEQVMNELAALIGGSGKVALLAGNEEAANLRSRAEGVQKAAAAHPGIQLIGPFFHEEKPQVAAARMLEVNKDNPDLKGWAIVGGWPLFRSSQTLALLNDLTQRKQKVVCVDALPEELLYVDRGLAVLWAQPVYDWGTVGVSAIVDKLYRDVAVEPRIKMQLVRVGPDNLAEWARQLQAWGFSVDPSAYDE